MINKKAELESRILLYNAIKGILRTKMAAGPSPYSGYQPPEPGPKMYPGTQYAMPAQPPVTQTGPTAYNNQYNKPLGVFDQARDYWGNLTGNVAMDHTAANEFMRAVNDDGSEVWSDDPTIYGREKYQSSPLDTVTAGKKGVGVNAFGAGNAIVGRGAHLYNAGNAWAHAAIRNAELQRQNAAAEKARWDAEGKTEQQRWEEKNGNLANAWDNYYNNLWAYQQGGTRHKPTPPPFPDTRPEDQRWHAAPGATTTPWRDAVSANAGKPYGPKPQQYAQMLSPVAPIAATIKTIQDSQQQYQKEYGNSEHQSSSPFVRPVSATVSNSRRGTPPPSQDPNKVRYVGNSEYGQIPEAIPQMQFQQAGGFGSFGGF